MAERTTRHPGRQPIHGPRRYVMLTSEQDAYIARLAAGWGCGWPVALRRVLDVLREAASEPSDA